MLKNKYNHNEVEQGKYTKWIEKGYFTAGDISKKPYCVVIPPPNVTGKLHIGHAFDNSIQDLLCRYHRLKGEDVLYLPGMDHAGIATQAKVDARLKEQGILRYDIGREKFLEKAWEWKAEYADNIHAQWAKLGLSLDYSRERFTLDEGLSKAVKEVFVRYYKEGLIYQGKRIINWDPAARTALSNIEVIHKDIKAYMYYIEYHLVDEDKTFVVATTRPETMFGDVCVAVHPEDKNLKDLIGKKCINPANGDILPIIGDEYIEIGFGTGAMKCTPAHDPNDYEIAKRHNLEMPICMNEDGTMNELCGKYNGLDRFKCREELLNEFREKGCLVKEEEIIHSVGHSERTGVMVEPYLSKQWFVKMKPLALDVLNAQKDPATKINFYPPRFEKTFEQWLENIEDWCISRQLWWGHRIPVYYHKDTNEVYCEVEPPKDIENYIQDEDVLDTWFSSALWPFSTLGWPEVTEDLKRYYPTSAMGTGYDILFFWVARMSFSARHFLKEVPFKDCLLHGLVRDEKGRKMSKSLGNGIDPIEVIEKYGADSLRYFLLTNSTPGLDMNFSNEKMEAAWNFFNKFYNAARYVEMNLGEDYHYEEPALLSETDHWIISSLNKTIKNMTANLDRYEIAMAGQELNKFIWDDFCSSYIEFSKAALNGDDEVLKANTRHILFKVLDAITILLHPYAPFVTEEIYQSLHGEDSSVCIANWPSITANVDEKKVADVELLLEIIKETRNLKTENNIKPSKELFFMYEGDLLVSKEMESVLAKMTHLVHTDKIDGETLVRPLSKGKLIFALNEIVDKEEELKKIDEQLKKLEAEIMRSEKILNNQGFLAKAPESKINEEKAKQESYKQAYEALIVKKKELTQ